MLGLGGMEIVIILAVILLLFGPKKLPEMGKALGKTIFELRHAGKEITKQAEELEKDLKK